DVFTDFGTPAAGGIPARPGNSGVQGIEGDLLISVPLPAGGTPPTTTTIDQNSLVSTNFRRFEDITFDQYGYFSQGFPTTATPATTTGIPTLGPPVSAGNLFVSDLATGQQVTLTLTGAPTTPAGSTANTAFPIEVQGTNETVTVVYHWVLDTATNTYN